MLNETWTSDEDVVSINGFDHIILNQTEKKAGTKRNSGGLIVYIRSELFDNNTFLKCENDDIIWLKLKDNLISDKPTYICLCYVLPAGTTRNSMVDSSVFDRLLDTVAEYGNNEPDSCFIICGDMNARIREMPDYVIDDTEQHIPLPDDYVIDDGIAPRVSQDKNGSNSNGQQLLDFCKQTSLIIANGRCGADSLIGDFTCTTSRGQSVVDYVLLSRHLLKQIETFEVGYPNILSDHSLVSFSLRTESIVNLANKETRTGRIADYKYVWDSSKVDDFKAKLWSETCTQMLDRMKNDLEQSIILSDSIDENIRSFVTTAENCAKPLFQKNIYKNSFCRNDDRGNAHWFTDECLNNRRLFYRCLNLYRGNKNDENRVDMVRARSKYKTSLRKARLNYDIRQTNKLNELRYKNARDYWKLLKSAANTGRPNIPLTTFERYFKADNNPDSAFYVADEDVLLSNDRYVREELHIMFEELNIPITQQEISKSIKQLKNNKSPGRDRLLNEFFIHGQHVLLPYIESIFNAILNNGYFPSDWSVGEIIPLHKKGSLNNVDNYRGITLLSAFGKLFTRVLDNRLTEWAEEYSIYVEAQAGFRTGMGTTDHIFALHGLLTHFLIRNKKMYCAFVDFSKAFDYVVRDNLWNVISSVRGGSWSMGKTY